MNPKQYADLLIEVFQGLSKVGWHWFSYHFYTGPTPFAESIINACGAIDDSAPGIGTELLRELLAIGGREKDEAQYEQLLQKLGEILVIERVVTCPWPAGTTFQHEPAATPNGRRPELLVIHPEGRLVVEVKTPALLGHIRKRAENSTQLAYRGGVSLELAEQLARGSITLPRDNPVLDFLKDGERKFAAFREDPDTVSLLVIVWDDFIYEPISALVNPGSGLLTEKTYARNADGTAQTYPNIDAVVALRHLHYFILGSRERQLGNRTSVMDFGDENALPNVLFTLPGARPIPQSIIDSLRACAYDDAGLRVFAEYNPQDIVLWI